MSQISVYTNITELGKIQFRAEQKHKEDVPNKNVNSKVPMKIQVNQVQLIT